MCKITLITTIFWYSSPKILPFFPTLFDRDAMIACVNNSSSGENMASFSKTKNGWRAQIMLKGMRDSSCFATKAQAMAWGAERETEIRRQCETGVIAGKTFGDACKRYEIAVSKTKRGHRWEAFRLHAMMNIALPYKEEAIGTKMGDCAQRREYAVNLGLDSAE
jgi:hypothetical protein